MGGGPGRRGIGSAWPTRQRMRGLAGSQNLAQHDRRPQGSRRGASRIPQAAALWGEPASAVGRGACPPGGLVSAGLPVGLPQRKLTRSAQGLEAAPSPDHPPAPSHGHCRLSGQPPLQVSLGGLLRPRPGAPHPGSSSHPAAGWRLGQAGVPGQGWLKRCPDSACSHSHCAFAHVPAALSQRP